MRNIFGLDLFFYISLFFIAPIGSAYAAYKKRHRKPNIPDTPVLMSYYTDGSEVVPLVLGEYKGLYYTQLATLAISTDSVSDPTAALIMRVELPFRTHIHLVGISRLEGIAQVDPSYGDGIMEQVYLEGNYSEHFGLYCEKGMQTEARYVLDPKAMVYTMDFCSTYSWEIIKDELYFVLSTAPDKDDHGLWEAVLHFIEEIRPAIEDKDNPVEKKLSTPYGQERRTDLKCPFCVNSLELTPNYCVCPQGHGVLINGSNLTLLNEGKISVPQSSISKYVRRDYDIVCPSCSTQMRRVNYNSGKTIIDSCPKCPYRWLDAGELSH